MTKSHIAALSVTGIMLLSALPAFACRAGYPDYPTSFLDSLQFAHDLPNFLSVAVGVCIVCLIPGSLISHFVYWKELTWSNFWEAFWLSLTTAILIGCFLYTFGHDCLNACIQLLHAHANKLSVRDQFSYGIVVAMTVICTAMQLAIYSLTGSKVKLGLFTMTLSANVLFSFAVGGYSLHVLSFLHYMGFFSRS